MSRILQSIVLCLILVSSSNAAVYRRTNSISGAGFLSAFSHQAIADLTQGRVKSADNIAKNLTYAGEDTFIMRADSTTKLNASGPGRDSVRIISRKPFSTHVFVMNIRHMPDGCATWPAAWEVGDDWPNNGEIDIIEGVNGVTPNQATLHTSASCTMPAISNQTGTTVGTDCATSATSNKGCGVTSGNPNSFAGGFNSVGGGCTPSSGYALERTDTEIKVWFWARNDRSVPADVKNGASYVNMSKWGTPFADFPNSKCDLAAKFEPSNIVINLTFCGDFSGVLFTSQGCGSDCNTFVDDNPSAFANAYWDFASLI